MPDGDIQLSVTLNSEDIRNKAEQLRDSVKRMLEANAGTQLEGSLKKISTEMTKLSAESAKLEERLGQIDRAYLSNLDQSISNTEAKIRDIQQELARVPQFAQSSPSYIQEKQTLDELLVKLAKLREERQAVSEQGVGMGFSDEYDQATMRLNGVNDQLVILKTRMEDAKMSSSGVVDGISGSSDRATGSVSTLGDTIRSAFSDLRSHIGSSDKQINNLATSVGGRLVSAFNKVKGAVEKAFSAKTLKRNLVTLIKYTVGVRSLYFLFRKLRNAVKEGLNNLVQYQSSSNATNKAMTELKTSLLYLKNAWASAFAPIINYVMPVLTALIDGLAEVGNAIARFIGALTGQTKVLNAVKTYAGDYAKSLDKVGSSAKKARDRLAPFDDLQILGKDDDGSGGGGGGAFEPDVDDMFEYVDAVSEFADLIKEAWENADFTKVGALIKDKIITALQSIDWEEVQQKGINIGKSAGTFLAGLFGDPQLFIESGNAFGEALNTITYSLQAFLDETGKIDFGSNLAQGLNEFLNTTDWRTAGENISEVFIQISDNIQSFLSTLEEDDLSASISDFVGGLNIPKLLEETGQTTITLTAKAIIVTASAIKELGTQLGEDLVIYVTDERSIRFTHEGQQVEVPWEPTIRWEDSPIQALTEKFFFDLGKYAVEDFMGGFMGYDISTEWIANANEKMKPLTEWAKTALLAPTSGLISSQLSKLGSEPDSAGQGEPITKYPTLLENIASLVITIKDNWRQVKEDLAKTNEGLVTSIEFIETLLNIAGAIWINSHGLVGWLIFGALNPDMVNEAFDEITNGLVDFVWGILENSQQLKDGIHDKVEEIKTNVAEGWENIKTTATEKWTQLTTNVITKATEIKDSVVNKFVALGDSVVSQFLLLKDNAIQKFNEIKGGIYNAFSSLATLIKTPINAVIGVVESFVNKIIKGINKLIGSFDGIGDLASQVGLTVPELKLSEITIPRLAQGAVIPPNKEFMAVLGDQTNGTNIEAPLDTIKQAVAEVMGSSGNAEVVQLLQQLITVVENKELNIGDKEIAKANARYNSRQGMIRGTSF